MAIFLTESSRVIVQGMTGSEGQKHTARMLASGTTIVGGVNPRKAGTTVDFPAGDGTGDTVSVPVFGTVADAVAATGADVSVVFVPPAFTKAAVIEAVDAGIPLVVIITEGIPVADTAEFFAHARAKGVRLIGPNCPGLISPGKSNAGIIPADITGPGPIGLVSKSGTLTYQMMYELRDLGFSTAIGIGGDPIIGTTHIDALAAFEADPETEAIVHDRRDRRRRRGARGGVHQGARHQAGRRLRRGLHRARGQDHGPRGRHRLRLGGHRAGQEGGPRGRRGQGRQDAERDRRPHARDPSAVRPPAGRAGGPGGAGAGGGGGGREGGGGRRRRGSPWSVGGC